MVRFAIPKLAGNEPDAFPSADLRAALPRLRRYARVLTGDSHHADDLVQDTLARAWEKRRLWRAGSDLRAWLFTIMHNVHVNQFALRRRDSACESLDVEGRARDIPVRASCTRRRRQRSTPDCGPRSVPAEKLSAPRSSDERSSSERLVPAVSWRQNRIQTPWRQ